MDGIVNFAGIRHVKDALLDLGHLQIREKF